MADQYLSDGEFWRLHRAWHRSPEARAMKRRLYEKQGHRCARSGEPLAWKDAVLNLTSYEDMKARRPVKDCDANVLHWRNHPKGTYTWGKLNADRAFDREVRLYALPFRLAWRLLEALGKALRRSRRPARP